MALQTFPTDGAKLMLQKNRQYELLVNTDRRRCWLHPEMNLLVLLFSPCQYGWTKELDLSKDELAIRYEIEKCRYIGVVFGKHPPMIKLEWNSIEINCKRIQIENSFWNEGCVYLCLWFMWVFIALVFIVWMNAFMKYGAVGIND